MSEEEKEDKKEDISQDDSAKQEEIQKLQSDLGDETPGQWYVLHT